MILVAQAGMGDRSDSQSSSAPMFLAYKKKLVSSFPSTSQEGGGWFRG